MFRAFFDHLYQWKAIIGVSFAIFMAAGYLLITITPRQFEGNLVVAPVSSSLLPKDEATSFTSLLRINQTDPRFDSYLLHLRGERLAARLIAEYPDIHKRLFPGRWDDANGRWRPSPSPVSRTIAAIDAIFGQVRPLEPGPVETSNVLSNIIRVDDLGDGDIHSIAIRSTDPDFARELLVLAHSLADTLVREAEQSRATANLAYLEDAVATTELLVQRNVLLDLIVAENQRLTFADADAPVAAEVLSGPHISARPVTPRPFQIMFLVGVFGVLIGAGLACLMPPRRRPGSVLSDAVTPSV